MSALISYINWVSPKTYTSTLTQVVIFSRLDIFMKHLHHRTKFQTRREEVKRASTSVTGRDIWHDRPCIRRMTNEVLWWIQACEHLSGLKVFCRLRVSKPPRLPCHLKGTSRSPTRDKTGPTKSSSLTPRAADTRTGWATKITEPGEVKDFTLPV